MSSNNVGKKLRELLARDEILLLPGGYDCISAKLAEAAGFEAVYMTGSGTAASRLGKPDVGLTTMTELVQNAKAMAECVNIPLVADADQGFGNAINVMRTVREYEQVGVAAIHIEDQVVPKKCGHFEGKRIVGREEFVGKIRAACDARRSSDFVIIARTDAIAVAGFDEAIARAKACVEAGADVLFVEAPESLEQIRLVGEKLSGTAPLLLNMGSPEGRTPFTTAKQAEEWGYKIALFAWAASLNVAARAMADAFRMLKESGGDQEPLYPMQYGWRNMTNLLGLPEITDLEKKYGTT